jgi:hypothetical protein
MVSGCATLSPRTIAPWAHRLSTQRYRAVREVPLWQVRWISDEIRSPHSQIEQPDRLAIGPTASVFDALELMAASIGASW